MKQNISLLHDCYGCGICVKACPVNIISLRKNISGFYSPVIDEQDKCIGCGMCLNTCAFNHNEVAQTYIDPMTWGAWSNDPLTRVWCSSGGVGFEIGKLLLEKGYEAIGVRFNVVKNRAEHYIAHNEEEFMPSVGSKYIPSYTTDALKEIDRKKKYLFTGTPCQIDSMRRYIQKMKLEDNFVLLDFFCHGVPSLLMWDKYIQNVSESIGQISFVSWRNKTTGWQDSWSMNIDITNNSNTIDWHDSYNLTIREKKHFYESRKSQGDMFYRFFLGNFCLNECCYTTCKYKMNHSAADIRIGDLWGKAYEKDSKGVSAVLAFTTKGQEIIKNLEGRCTLKSLDFNTTVEGQMSRNAHKPKIYKTIIASLRTNMSLKQIYNTVIFMSRVINKLSK